MKQRRATRWALFFLSAACFFYVLFVDNDSLAALAGFFAFGGFWYWLERRKMTELDAPRPPNS